MFTDSNHNLNTITGLTITNGGTGYAVGDNVTLVSPHIVGRDATVNITSVGTGNSITGLSIVDGGSAYGVGNTVNVSTGSANAILTIANINSNVGDVVQVVGVGTTSNRFNSGYNGLYKVTSIPGANSIVYNAGSNPGIYTTGNGILFLSLIHI